MSGIVPSTISLTPARSVSCESSDTLPMADDELGTNFNCMQKLYCIYNKYYNLTHN